MMLADLEWNSPHQTPNGGTLAQWVEEVRRMEANGIALRDPETLNLDARQLEYRRGAGIICLCLCWRERCHRAKRCRHYFQLAIKEFQPEFGIFLYEHLGLTLNHYGPVDEEKLALVRERLCYLPKPKLPFPFPETDKPK
jgi:hypothetical protein